jgi:hypothetical protein
MFLTADLHRFTQILIEKLGGDFFESVFIRGNLRINQQAVRGMGDCCYRTKGTERTKRIKGDWLSP